MLIIKLFVKLIHFYFVICMLFKTFCMIQKIITDDKWPLILGLFTKMIIDFSRNSGCIRKKNVFTEFSVFENICLDTKMMNIA